MAAEIARVCGARRGRRLPALRRRSPRELWRLERRRLHRPQPRPPARPGPAGAAAACPAGADSAASVGRIGDFFRDPRTQRIFSFQALYAGVAPQQALALYAVISYLDSVAGVYFPKGGMHAVPQALAGAAEQARGDDPLRHHGHPGRDVPGPGPGGAHRRRRADPGRRGGAQPRPAGRLPRPAAGRAGRPSGWPGCATRRPAWCCTSVRRQRYSKIAHHNLHFGRAWPATFDDVIDRGRLMRDPSLLVTNPTRTDPALAPAGRQSLLRARPGAEPGRGRTDARRLARRAWPSGTPTS